MKCLGAATFIFLLISNAGFVMAQDSQGVDFVGYLPGTIEDVHIQGDFAYCATQCGLLVLDVSAATDPVQVAFLPLYHEEHLFLSLYRGLAVDGDFAYLVGPWGPLQIVDISNPVSPLLVGTCDALEYAYDVVASGGFAYVTDENEGLRIIDVSDPAEAHQVGFVALPGRSRGLVLDETTVYVATYIDGLRIIDVSNPAAPVEIGVFDVGGSHRDVDVAGDLAFVTWGGGIRIVDVGVPGAPVEVGAFSAAEFGSVFDVDVVGEYAYLSYVSTGLRIVDISDPELPFEVGSCDIYGPSTHLMVAGDHTYLATGYRGLHIIDIEKPEEPTIAGWYFTLGIAADVQVEGDHAYVAGGYTCDAKGGPSKEGTSGFFVVALEDPTLPALTGFSPIYAPAMGVAVAGSLACLVTWYDSFHCYDVSDPFSPVEMSGLILAGGARRVQLIGDLAYLAHSGLRIMDISNPVEPVEVGHFHPHQSVADVQVLGSLAFLAEYQDGLIVVDVGDPTDPVEIGRAPLPYRAEAVAVDRDHAYVADWREGLIVFDISDPTTPVQVGKCPTPGYAFDVAVSGNFAYVVDQNEGIRVIDVSVPSAPVEVGFYKVLIPFQSVTTHGKYIYATCGYGGLFVLSNDAVAGLDPDDLLPVSPSKYSLGQNHPNPFNPSTTIRFDLPESAAVSLRVFDVTGRLVRVLLGNETVPAGTNKAVWNGRDDTRRVVAAGVYFYRLETVTYSETRSMTLVK